MHASECNLKANPVFETHIHTHAEWYTLRIRAWSPTTGRTYTVAGTGTPSCGADGAALATDFESATAGVCVDDAQGVAYVVEYSECGLGVCMGIDSRRSACACTRSCADAKHAHLHAHTPACNRVRVVDLNRGTVTTVAGTSVRPHCPPAALPVPAAAATSAHSMVLLAPLQRLYRHACWQ